MINLTEFVLTKKCGNCTNYDLCEYCEQNSQNIHPTDHIFLKIKNPIPQQMHTGPLLSKNLYQEGYGGFGGSTFPGFGGQKGFF